jgi:hypothetical protein
MKRKRLNAMPPLAKFLVLLAIFVSASHANAFTCLALLLLHEIKIG